MAGDSYSGPTSGLGIRTLGAVLVLALFLVGCGDLGATEDELAEERKAGEQIGTRHAERGIEQRIQTAHEEGHWDGETAGEERGWSQGWDDAEEAIEETAYGEGSINPQPIKQNGEPSYEFEPDDIEQAEESYEEEELREYCEGAVSEAQEVGCLSHVEPWEVP